MDYKMIKIDCFCNYDEKQKDLYDDIFHMTHSLNDTYEEYNQWFNQVFFRRA